MDLKTTDHALSTLLPQMAAGFAIKTPGGEFLMHKNDGLGDAIEQVKTLLEQRQKHWIKHSCNSALAQLDRYIELMSNTPGGATPLQAEKLKGFVEALYFAELLSEEDAGIYTRVIDGVVQTEALVSPFFTEGLAS